MKWTLTAALPALALSIGINCAEANTGTQFAAAVKVGTLASNSLTETSGCASGRINSNTFWVHNDSGDSARIFAINRSGGTLGIFNLSGASAHDYEDIDIGPGPVAGKSYIYVGDIGDNGNSRPNVQVYRTPEPKIGSSTTLSVEKFTLQYPDGSNNAEALMVDPWTSDLYILTKGNSSKVFRFKAPLQSGHSYVGERVGTLNIGGLTGGDISVDGSRIIVSTNKSQTGTPRFFLWLRKTGESVATALQRTPVQLPAVSGQLEAVCWDNQGVDFYAVTEGTHVPFYYFKSLDSNGTTNGSTGGDTGSSGSSGSGGDTPTNSNSLQTSDVMHGNDYLASANGRYRFYLQSDGNLVLRDWTTRAALWSAGTAGKGGSLLTLQDDGNLVLYTSAHKALWSSKTAGTSTSRLVLNNDGSLALYDGDSPIWAVNGDGNTGDSGTASSGTSASGSNSTAPSSLQVNDQLQSNDYLASANGRYRFYLQTDGNLVLRDWTTRAALWASGTAGKGGSLLILQDDGNLVLYTQAHNAVWSSHSAGTSASRLVLNDDGSLALYYGDSPIWAVNGDGTSNTGSTGGSTSGGSLPNYDHVVVVIEENHSKSNIIGNSAAPYINSLASNGVLFSQSYAIEHPSQPNYLDLFSGSNQGITNDNCPVGPFGASNLASQLVAAGLSFTGYLEGLPSQGSLACSSGAYVRKHAPWTNFRNVASWMSKPLTDFPGDYSMLPTVSWVIPNLNNDMHNGTVTQADNWLKSHLGGYANWAKTHNSLLIVTWDEDDHAENNKIPTIFYGANLKKGTYSEQINHFAVLRLLEDLYGLPHAGKAASAHDIRDVFN